MLLAVCVGSLGVYKLIRKLLKYLPRNIDTKITQSQLILQVFTSYRSVYVPLLSVDGVHSQLSIPRNHEVSDLVLVGFFWPVLSYVWSATVVNSTTHQVTHTERIVHVYKKLDISKGMGVRGWGRV